MNTSTAAPRWTRIYIGITGVLSLLFGTLAYLNPSIQFGAWEALETAGALSLTGPLGLYIARNLAEGVVGLVAARASVPFLMAAFLMRTVTEALDTVHALLGGAGLTGALFPLVMLALDIAGLWVLSRSATPKADV